MRYMREIIKKIIRKIWGLVLAVLLYILYLFDDEIKTALLQLNINLPRFDIITAIFAIGIIVGVVAFAIEGVLSLRKNRIEIYNSREELPLLKNRLLQAKQEISFLGVTLEKLIGQEASTIKDTIKRGVHMKFLIS